MTVEEKEKQFALAMQNEVSELFVIGLLLTVIVVVATVVFTILYK